MCSLRIQRDWLNSLNHSNSMNTDLSSLSTADIQHMLKQVLLQRALNPDESSQILALALKVWNVLDTDEQSKPNPLKSLSTDELRARLRNYK